jgi:hypothetical protein
MTSRVRIVKPTHPHHGETGIWTGEVIVFDHWDGKMGKVKLDNCPHRTDACFVSPGDIELVEPSGESG